MSPPRAPSEAAVAAAEEEEEAVIVDAHSDFIVGQSASEGLSDDVAATAVAVVVGEEREQPEEATDTEDSDNHDDLWELEDGGTEEELLPLEALRTVEVEDEEGEDCEDDAEDDRGQEQLQQH